MNNILKLFGYLFQSEFYILPVLFVYCMSQFSLVAHRRDESKYITIKLHKCAHDHLAIYRAIHCSAVCYKKN